MSAIHNLSLTSTDSNDRYPCRFAWGDARAIALPVVKLSSALCMFYTVGRLTGNPASKRDLGLLTVAVLLMQPGLIYDVAQELLSVSTPLYLIGTLATQITLVKLVQHHERRISHSSIACEQPFLKPMILPSQTTHTRLFPSKHSFSYSYLFVGVPIGWQGTAGNLLSMGQNVSKHSWFSVDASDYLARGDHEDGLTGKLRDYLKSQGIPVERYTDAYLVTAPRFLGFSFNPVSFWYLYEPSGMLTTMILEVNNTFDERRLYLMKREIRDSETMVDTFRCSWRKDFHVSPFSDREGCYSLKAQNVRSAIDSVHVDNHIVLSDNDGKPKVIARVFSTEPGIDPAALSVAARWMFLVRWWWVGFMTNPRILKEARTLWVKKLQVYYRPEVLKSSIGRNETVEERNLEPYFRAFLGELVKMQQASVAITYQPAAGRDRGKPIQLSDCGSAETASRCESLDVYILTPAFYSEIARANSIMQAFKRFCFQSTDGEAMLNVSDHGLLQRLLQQLQSRLDRTSPIATLSSPGQLFVAYLKSKSVKDMTEPSREATSNHTQAGLVHSEFDLYVSQYHSPDRYRAYLRIATRLLLADCAAFGYGWLLSLECLLVQSICFAQLCRMLPIERILLWTKADWSSLVLYALVFHGLKAYLAID